MFICNQACMNFCRLFFIVQSIKQWLFIYAHWLTHPSLNWGIFTQYLLLYYFLVWQPDEFYSRKLITTHCTIPLCGITSLPTGYVIPQYIILNSHSDIFSQWLHQIFWLSIFGNLILNLHRKSVANRPHFCTSPPISIAHFCWRLNFCHLIQMHIIHYNGAKRTKLSIYWRYTFEC